MLSKFKPLLSIESVDGLSVQWLKSNKFKAVVFDLDRTLIGHYDVSFPKKSIDLINKLQTEGVKVGILSNAKSSARLERFNNLINSLKTTQKIAYLTSKESWSSKPRRAPFMKIAEKLGVKPDNICYVGDQVIKDVFGAKRSGYGGAVLVKPFGNDDHLGVKYLQRPIERVIKTLNSTPRFIDLNKSSTKILSWNVLYKNDPRDIILAIDDMQNKFGSFDYICLSEVTKPLLKLVEQKYNVLYQLRDEKEGVIIATRDSLQNGRVEPLAYDKNASHNTYLSTVDFKTRGGDTLTLATTHLTFNRPRNYKNRKLEIQKLTKILPRSKLILVGDLNTYPTQINRRKIEKAGYKRRSSGKTWQKDYFGWLVTHQMSIDHVFASPDIADKVHSLVLDDFYCSDHRPVIVAVD